MLLRATFASAAVVLAVAAPAAASEQASRSGFDSFGVGAEGGMLFPGAVHLKSTSLDTAPGAFASVYGDLVAGGFVSFGFAGVFASPTIEGLGAATLFDFAATFKTRIGLTRWLELRPGITLGYQIVTGTFDAAKGFDPGLTVSFAWRASESAAVVLDGGFLSQPVGGSRDATVTFAPIAYGALGIEVGK